MFSVVRTCLSVSHFKEYGKMGHSQITARFDQFESDGNKWSENERQSEKVGEDTFIPKILQVQPIIIGHYSCVEQC